MLGCTRARRGGAVLRQRCRNATPRRVSLGRRGHRRRCTGAARRLALRDADDQGDRRERLCGRPACSNGIRGEDAGGLIAAALAGCRRRPQPDHRRLRRRHRTAVSGDRRGVVRAAIRCLSPVDRGDGQRDGRSARRADRVLRSDAGIRAAAARRQPARRSGAFRAAARGRERRCLPAACQGRLGQAIRTRRSSCLAQVPTGPMSRWIRGRRCGSSSRSRAFRVAAARR